MAALRDRIEAELPALRRYALVLVHDPDRADDLVQDCVERALRKHRLWRRPGNLRAWLFTILRHIHFNQARKGRRELNTFPMTEDVAARDTAPPEHVQLQQTVEALWKLTTDQREVLMLVIVEGLSHREAATVLGIPVGTVMSRLSRARDCLRVLIDGAPLRWVVAAAVLLAVLVAGDAGLWSLQTLRSPSPLDAVANGAIEAYRSLPWSTPSRTEDATGEASTLSRWASNVLGHRVRVPDLSDRGYRLVDRRVQHAGGGAEVVSVAFESPTGGRVLCYFKRRRGTDESPLRFRDDGDVAAVFRVDEDVAYAVAGTVGRSELTRIARLAYAGEARDAQTGE